MPILTKEVEVTPMGTVIQYYRNKGYNAKHKQPLMVSVEDLPRGSGTKIEVLCDICHKNKMIVRYCDYNKTMKKTGSYVCRECTPQKIKYRFQELYGVSNISQLEWVQEKVKQTNIERYGVGNYAKTQEFLEKSKQTNLERYNVDNYAKTQECREKTKETVKRKYGVEYYLQSSEFKERYHNICVEKYGESYHKHFVQKAFNAFYNRTGYKFPIYSPEVKEKMKQTCIEKYGYEYNLQSPEVREKISQTLYSNSSQKTSKQQRYINDLYQGILNFPIKYYNVDIYLPKDDIVIEYDGGGHMLNVIIGRQTMEEYQQKEIARYNVIKREGYKQMKIISSKDFLPSDQILLQMLNDAKQYFSSTNHSWIYYDIDNSKMINAENKDFNGVFYDYGELRIIKEVV